MIVRVMAEGQYRVDEARWRQIHALDDELLKELEAGHEAEFRRLVEQAVSLARGGEPLAPDQLVASDLILPPPDITLDEARRFLAEADR
ncbi:MAG: hypothetical protein K6U14_00080 [Firmicutes bacterium]|nr:hypothetical protein [Alicyclobacillaceae bacterium]MCL6496021.1 hypothetical protein [Bacillota bacterium]